MEFKGAPLFQVAAYWTQSHVLSHLPVCMEIQLKCSRYDENDDKPFESHTLTIKFTMLVASLLGETSGG